MKADSHYRRALLAALLVFLPVRQRLHRKSAPHGSREGAHMLLQGV